MCLLWEKQGGQCGQNGASEGKRGRKWGRRGAMCVGGHVALCETLLVLGLLCQVREKLGEEFPLQEAAVGAGA